MDHTLALRNAGTDIYEEFLTTNFPVFRHPNAPTVCLNKVLQQIGALSVPNAPLSLFDPPFSLYNVEEANNLLHYFFWQLRLFLQVVE